MGSKYDSVELTGHDADIAKVLKNHENKLASLEERLASMDQSVEDSIASSERMLKDLGYSLPKPTPPDGVLRPKPMVSPTMRPWSEILADAEKNIENEVSLNDLLSASEIAQGEQKIQLLREKFDMEHRLDGVDWAISGVAGVMAALVDTFLVKMPSSAGFAGMGKTQGGALSDFIKQRIQNAHTSEEINMLEKLYKVPYDAPHSGSLQEKISGLGPRTHRFQSVGHDPILGFLFGIKDILKGEMTSIDSSGNLIVQSIDSNETGISLFDAIARQFGHLRSDISTPGGLPAPLMPLLQFVQKGQFGEKGRTIGEISKLMYVKGYDFSHFLSMSIPVLLIEALVRFCYCMKRLQEGHDIEASLPFNVRGEPSKPKLQTMLFTAHLISTSVNCGRVYLTGNPLAINYPQWIMFAKNSIQQLNWILVKKGNERFEYVQSKIDADWEHLNRDLSVWWEDVKKTPEVLVFP